MKEKLCKKCGSVKLIEEFHVDNSTKTGRTANCRDCRNDRMLNYFRTKRGLILRIYHDQIKTSKRRNYSLPDYSFDILYDYLTSNNLFDILFKQWENNNYSKDYTPSLDRIDDYKPYSLDNIQLMTWKENNLKGYEDRRNGVNTKKNKAVKCTDLATGEEKIFGSVKEAQIKMNVCFGEVRKSKMLYHNMLWEYITP